MGPRNDFCQKHPTYQVKRAPTADCEPCRQAWTRKKLKLGQMRLEVDKLFEVFPTAKQIELRVDDHMIQTFDKTR